MAEVVEQSEVKAKRNGNEADGNGHLRHEAESAAPPPETVVNADSQTSVTESHEIAEDVQPIKKKPIYKRPAFLIGTLVVLVLATIFGVRYWNYSSSHASTDDAFIDGHIIQVSPKVSGTVVKVYVADNQPVKAGDLLAELDARDLEARLAQAQASLKAGQAQERQAQTGVTLTRANTQASTQQASAVVQQARSGVETARAAAAAERSRISQAGSAISTAQANVAQARAQVIAAQAEAARANSDVRRYQELFNKDEVSRQRLDQAVAAAQTSTAQLEATRQRVAAAEAQVNEARAAQVAAAENARRVQTQIGGAQAQVNQALGGLSQANTAPQQLAVSQAQAATAGANIEQLRTAVAQAELELSYTKIYAPESGRVTRKAIEESAVVQAGQLLMAIVPGEVWVTANFKESQLGELHPGQHVEIKVDAYPKSTFKGHIDSVQAGTGARFSLLPAENATGNYVKVVQRVPVKIVFDEQPDQNHLLAPGMSVEPEVQVR